MINAKIKNEIKESYRAGASIPEIAKSFGYKEREIDKVIFPNGKQSKELALVIHRTRPKHTIIKEEKILQDGSEGASEQPREGKSKIKDEKWIAAGKKAWETRKRRLAEASAQSPPPLDQPVVQYLSTMPQEDKEEALRLIEEALEYIQVGLTNIQKALELLKR